MSKTRPAGYMIGPLILSLLLVIAVPAPGVILAAHSAGGVDWQTIVDSDFSGNLAGGWPIGNGGFFDEHVDYGRYTLSASDHETGLAIPRNMLALADGRITATFRLDGQGQVGLAVRSNATADTVYRFWIDRLGDSGGIRVANGTPSTLFALHSASINTAGDNTLAAQAAGNELAFFINGQQVYHYIERQPLPAGAWGVYVQSGRAQGMVQGHFARITIIGSALSPAVPPLSTGPFRAIVDSDFSVGNDHGWSVGLYPHANSQVAGGRYTISTTSGYTQLGTANDVPARANGQIGAIVRPEGAGRVGVVARWTSTRVGNRWSLYACWISTTGSVGCTKWLKDTVTTLFLLHSDRIKRNGDNALVLRMQGNRLTFWLNDQRVYVYSDRHPLPAGYWGAYVSSEAGAGGTQGHYRRILLAG